MIKRMIEKIKLWILSFKVWREVTRNFMEETRGMDKQSREYLQIYKFNSYIKMSRVKITPYKIIVKIRIPQTFEGKRKVKEDWKAAVDLVASMTDFKALSSDFTDKYYYTMTGTK